MDPLFVHFHQAEAHAMVSKHRLDKEGILLTPTPFQTFHATRHHLPQEGRGTATMMLLSAVNVTAETVLDVGLLRPLPTETAMYHVGPKCEGALTENARQEKQTKATSLCIPSKPYLLVPQLSES
jgi:hypothetical protein